MLTSYRFRILEPMWRAIEPITLDRTARDVGKIKRIVEVLQEGKIVGLFPEGGLQREDRQLRDFQPGIGVIARRSGAVIVPVWIEGTPARRSMLLHFLQPSRSRVSFGEPWTPPPDMEPEAITDELRKRMLAVASGA
jgi:1-acyl-sn-glycerol-3-phosphate acyltransferase